MIVQDSTYGLEYTDSLPESCKKFSEEDIGETEEIRQESLTHIQQWLSENPNINADPNPVFLLYFLRSCKFNVDKTKERIKT